jgi:hypothetical protein
LGFRSPLPKNTANLSLDATASIHPVAAAHQQLIVVGFPMTNMGSHRQVDSRFFQVLCLSASANPPTVLATCMLGDRRFPTRWAARIQLPHTLGKARNVLLVQLCSSFGFSLTSSRSNFNVRQAVLLGLLQSTFLN